MKKLPLEYSFFLLYPLVLALPLPLISSSIALALGFMNVLVLNIVRGTLKSFVFKGLFNNILIVFGVIVLSLDMLTYSVRSFGLEFFVRDVRVSFLIVPMMMWPIRNQIKNLKKYLLFSLVAGVLLYIIYAFCYLGYFYGSNMTSRRFEISHYLIYDLRKNVPGIYHHTYIGMYMTFAIAILLNYAKNKFRMFFLALAFFILVNQVLFGSKLTLVLSLALVVFYTFKFVKAKLAPLLIVLVLGIVVLSTLVFKSGLVDSLSFSASNRIESWQCALTGFFEKPFLGHGNEASVMYLEKCITTDAVSSHNQYLEEVLNYGLFGLWLPVFFAILLLRPKKPILYTVLVLLFAVVSCFENTLSLQRGVLFFTFFVSMLLFESGADKVACAP
ncbi:MAG: O-antigen ligase family protein [Flavobacteriaceae bacterium]